MNLRLGRPRHCGIDVVRQHAIRNVDRSGSGLGLILGFGDDHGDVIADITHLVDGEDGMGPRLHGRSVLRVNHPAADQPADLVLGHFIAGENTDHARHLLRLGGVDRLDGGMRMGAAHEICPGLPRQVDVVGVIALACDEAQVFLAPYAGADAGSGLAHVM